MLSDLDRGYQNEFPTKLIHAYRNEIRFSNWRDRGRFDYSSNAVTCNWYNGKGAKYFRAENLKEIMARLDRGDTLKIGLDYYALFPFTLDIGEKLKRKIYDRVASGEIVTMWIYKVNEQIIEVI